MSFPPSAITSFFYRPIISHRSVLLCRTSCYWLTYYIKVRSPFRLRWWLIIFVFFSLFCGLVFSFVVSFSVAIDFAVGQQHVMLWSLFLLLDCLLCCCCVVLLLLFPSFFPLCCFFLYFLFSDYFFVVVSLFLLLCFDFCCTVLQSRTTVEIIA